MDVSTLITLALVAVVLIWLVQLYNRLVRVKHNVAAAWSNIDVLLQQRHDELPNLVATCKQYMNYERDTLERVVKARAGVEQAREDGDVLALGTAEATLHSSLGGLFALAENYPDLKADHAFGQLQTRISSIEDAIADRREFYNASVNANNIAIAEFPTVIVARAFNFSAADLLVVPEAKKAEVKVANLFDDGGDIRKAS
ncbi:MAG: LemA family protein [Pseudomonadota bacterium]